MANFEFIQETDRALELKFTNKIQSVSAAVFKVVEIPSSVFITVLLCDEEKIKQLNFSFRKIDKATDVLSWKHNGIEENSALQQEFPFGEIAICDSFCQKQAEQNGWDFETEFLRLFVHGITHLADYHHQTESDDKKMLVKEKEVLALFGLQKIYP